jgi:dTDP-4-amino-4,6-dideoxygalactose transaminase
MDTQAPTQALQVPFVDLAVEYSKLVGEIGPAIDRVLRDADLILGRDVALFEKEFASFCEAGHAVGVDSGLSALELILRANQIGPGDEVITAANTFIASALAISSVGARPVLVDVDPETYTMDPAALRAAITPRTAAVMPVHLYGCPADMDAILGIARSHGLLVIEDACQAHGARYKGRRAGSLGDAAAFSFYPAKNLGAYGDGGIVVTDDADVAQRVAMDRNYGQREKYYHEIRGHNHRLDTVQAAVLRVKLQRLEQGNAARREHARLYTELLENSGVAIPTAPPWAEPVWHLFVIRHEKRDALKGWLAENGIATGIHYPIPIHLQEAYRDLGHKKGDFPITEAYAEQILSLPMYPNLTAQTVEYVAKMVREFPIKKCLSAASQELVFDSHVS